MSPTRRIDSGSPPKLRQVLSRIARSLDDIVGVRGRYQPGRHGARLAFALALSLLVHAFVLTLRFGIAEFGLPGLALPWAERRAFTSDLSVRLAEAPRARTASAVRPPAPRTFVARTPATRAKRRQPRTKAVARAAPTALPALQPSAQPELIAQAQPAQETFSVPPPMPAEPEPEPAVALKQAEESPSPVKEPEQEKLQEEARLQEEMKRQEEARREEEARRQEQARAAREALELEARRRAKEEAAREQVAALARQQGLELEARKQEEAKKQEEEAKAARLALELEALRQAEEAARQAAALARRREEEEAKRQAAELAARERAAQELAERRRAEALAAAEPGRSAAGTIGQGRPSGSELASKALEQLRSAGRAEPQGPPRPSPPSTAAPSRRRSLFGGAERDIGLRMYADSWRWKIERNGSLNYPSGARTRAAENPVVTVAIRRDGSVEGVVIHRSSGQRDLDERVRRIVALFAPYSAFPPALARAYDVIEIRRVWIFADTLRILEEPN